MLPHHPQHALLIDRQPLVAFFELQAPLPHTPAGALMDLTGLVRLGQERVAPRIIQGWADLVRVAELRYRRALQALQHDPGLGLGILWASVHG
jgi:hypothetical protein